MKVEEAQEIFGEDYIGPADVENAFGITTTTTSDIVFPDAVLQRAKKLKYKLIFHPEGDYSIAQLFGLFKQKHGKAFPILAPSSIDGTLEATTNPLEFNVTPIVTVDRSSFAKIVCEKVRSGWFLVSPCIQPGIGQTYFTQTLYAYEHLWDSFFKIIKPPEHIQDAFHEIQNLYPWYNARYRILKRLLKIPYAKKIEAASCRHELEEFERIHKLDERIRKNSLFYPINDSMTKDNIRRVASLKINRLVRPTPADVYLDVVISNLKYGKSSLIKQNEIGTTLFSDSGFLHVGYDTMIDIYDKKLDTHESCVATTFSGLGDNQWHRHECCAVYLAPFE